MKISTYVMLAVLAVLSVTIGVYLVMNKGSMRYPLRSVSPTPSPVATPLESPVPLPSLHPLITVDSPQPESRISSPLVITGQARGNWYFEATFPVVLTDWDGLIIAEGYATTQSDWMTEEFVPFEATLTFDKPSYGDRGSLILQKANPSDLPENDDAYEMTVWFE